MLLKTLAFEQDRNSIFLRNQELHHHFSRLESIKQRKNIYLPEIPPSKSHIGLKKNFSSPSFLSDKQRFIKHDNKIIFQKLDKISHRINQLNNETEIIDGYLNIKKNTRDKVRELKKDLIEKENVKIKERISHTKPVIINKLLDDEFQKMKKISGYLRKVRPQGGPGNVYLNRNESKILRKYERKKAELYIKNKENENNNDLEFFTKRKNFSTDNINKVNTPTFNKKNNLNIDKKILKKIAYI